MTDPLETIWEDVHQKPAQEFVRRQRHYFLPLRVLIVLIGEIGESHLPVFQFDQTGVPGIGTRAGLEPPGPKGWAAFLVSSTIVFEFRTVPDSAVRSPLPREATSAFQLRNFPVSPFRPVATVSGWRRSMHNSPMWPLAYARGVVILKPPLCATAEPSAEKNVTFARPIRETAQCFPSPDAR